VTTERREIPKGWGHQSLALDKGKALRDQGVRGLALFFGVGLGKSFTSIRYLCEAMNEERRVFRTLLFTKPLVVPQFEEEFYKFSNIKPASITLLQGSQKERIRDFLAHAYKDGKPVPHIFLTNTEALIMKELYEEMRKWVAEAIVFDECHDLKNHEAQRSEAAYDLANPYDKKLKLFGPKPLTLLLSGSPVLTTPLDIFHQVKIMLGGFPLRPYFSGNRNALITNFYHFRGQFFRDKNAHMKGSVNYFPDWTPMTKERDGFDSIGELSYILSQISCYATKWTCPELNLPPEYDVTIPCAMTEHQARVYKEMKNDFVAYVSNDRACTASLAIVKSLRLMQIVSGFVSTEGRGEEDDVADIRFPGTEKVEKLRRLIKDVAPTQKILVWSVWRENYAQVRQVCEELGVAYVEFHGGISDKKKLANVHAFKTDPRVRVASGHPGSGGVGLNLTVAPVDIFHSRNYSTLHYVQARGRNHRPPQTSPVTHNNLSCQGTIDDVVLAQLAQNVAMAEDLLDPSRRSLSYKEVARGLMES
jgi:SNF2 family DNA or RNA helicase